jgi:hypothetical protein
MFCNCGDDVDDDYNDCDCLYRFALYGKETRRVMLYLANVKTSDEMFLPTLLQVLTPVT